MKPTPPDIPMHRIGVAPTPTEAVVAIAELVVRQRPDLLPSFVEMACRTGFTYTLQELAAGFEIRDPRRELAGAVFHASECLDLLERRKGWKEPTEVLRRPNLAALCSLCRARAWNVAHSGRRRRLEAMARKLEGARDQQAAAKRITDFLGLETEDDDRHATSRRISDFIGLGAKRGGPKPDGDPEA